MLMEKRGTARLDKVIDGAFYSASDGTAGDMIVTNVSRSGFRAALSRTVVPGDKIRCALRSLRRAMPVFTTGKVVWVREKNKPVTFGYDAGVELMETDSLDKQKISECDIGSWHMRHIADYALQRGYLAKKFPEARSCPVSFLPSLFLLYVAAGAVGALLQPWFGLVYAGTIAAYLMAIFFSSMIALGSRRSGQSFLFYLRRCVTVSAGRIAEHLGYGLFFLKGLLTPSLKNIGS